MKIVSSDHCIREFSSRNEPVLHVVPGEAFCLQTQDCYSNMVRTTRDRLRQKKGWGNPATGPVYVRGAAPGDILRIDIERIKIRDYAVMHVDERSGALKDYNQGTEVKTYPIRAGRVILRKNLSIPVRPMVGVIGTAPARRAFTSKTPDEHGGNMDCKEITEGASVYLPVGVKGALLALGDLHAVMGDGEVCICAAEVSGEVVVRASVLHTCLPTPCVETTAGMNFIGSAKSLDRCERMVLDKSHRFLTGMLGLAPNEASRIMSLAGDLKVCQVVDPLKTMRFSLPKSILKKLGMRSR